MSAIDGALDAANAALGKPPKDFAWGKQWRSFFRMVLLPIESKRLEAIFGYAGRVHADAVRKFISAATVDIYKAQCTALGIVIWRVIQPAIVPPMVGILILYAIHATLELLGVSFLDLRLLSIVGIVASYPREKVLERAFERWHLRRYGRACAHTALRLFWAEVRARSALVGLMALSKAKPKLPEAIKTHFIFAATCEFNLTHDAQVADLGLKRTISRVRRSFSWPCGRHIGDWSGGAEISRKRLSEPMPTKIVRLALMQGQGVADRSLTLAVRCVARVPPHRAG